MTVDQLMAASKGQMKRCGMACDKQKTDSETALLYTPYQSGEFSFTAFAFFNNQTKTLSGISLRLDDRQKGYALIAALKGKYGEPSSQTDVSLMTIVHWRNAGDQVEVMLIGYPQDHDATLSYRPKLTTSNKGL
jgi:hypothetical protein